MSFKLHCEKVLPLVYDNTLSYYEVLCKLAKAVDDIPEVVANPSESGTVTLTKLTVGDTTYIIPSQLTVVANPSTASSADLAKLTVGNTTYAIPTPTTVVANPSGTGTADLSKLTVGNTVYRIPTASTGNMYMTTVTVNHTISTGVTLRAVMQLFTKTSISSTTVTGENAWNAITALYPSGTGKLPVSGNCYQDSNGTTVGGYIDTFTCYEYTGGLKLYSLVPVLFAQISPGIQGGSVSDITVSASIEIK